MSMEKHERSIRDELRLLTGNNKLKVDDIMEWSTGNINPHEGETLYELSGGVSACVKSALVKVKKESE